MEPANLEQRGQVASAGAYDPVRREQLQRLRVGATGHGQEPYLQRGQPQQHPGFRWPDHGCQPVLQHGAAPDRPGRGVGRCRLRRGRRHPFQGPRRRADNEGLHGLRLLRARPRLAQCLGVDGVRRQHRQRQGAAEDQPPAVTVPGRDDRLGLLRPLPRLYPRLGDSQDAAGVLHRPVRLYVDYLAEFFREMRKTTMATPSGATSASVAT